MISNSVNELFESINNSKEYQDYLKIKEVLEKDESIISLIEEIKKLQQESVNLEFNGDEKYKEIDKVIEEKAKILNSNPTYLEYLNRMDEFNDEYIIDKNVLKKELNSSKMVLRIFFKVYENITEKKEIEKIEEKE